MPAPPGVPADAGTHTTPPNLEGAPPPRPLSLPTPAPRRTPTPTPTPPPLHPVPHATPQAPPPQQSPARRQTPSPLLWCLLAGASVLMCLPTGTGHRTQDVRRTPAHHPGPATLKTMVALLIVLGAGAAPRAMSVSWSARDATHGRTNGRNLSTCPARTALSAPTDPTHAPPRRPDCRSPGHDTPTRRQAARARECDGRAGRSPE